MRITRTEYLNKLIAFKDKQLIKVVTGIRRCGKSVLMEMYQDWLLQNGVEQDQIIAINFEDMDFEELTDYRKLYAYLKDRLVPEKMTYIFLDEIQHVTDFPKVIDSLYIKKNVDIYVTGSNAYMLSSEIATLISGRYVQIEMLPLSFKEYMQSTGSMEDRGIKYTEYLENSSFPYALELKGHPNEIRDYLDGIFNTIVVKDILTRRKILDPLMLKSVLRYVFDNIGSPLSSKKIADTLTSEGRKVDVKTVERYLDALIESYIIYPAQRYNVKGKQYLKTLGKYYVVDIGMRFMLLGKRNTDAGHILENVAVWSKNPDVDPVGACIGARGVRVEKIVQELNGEKIDVIRWSEDIAEFISAALSPAKVVKVELLPGETKSCRVTVPDQQLSLAIGNKGQNVRLCAHLTGYNIDIRPESGYYGEDEE